MDEGNHAMQQLDWRTLMRRALVLGLLVACFSQLGLTSDSKPRFAAVAVAKKNGPSSLRYRFTVDYYQISATGVVGSTQRIVGDSTLDRRTGERQWTHVVMGKASGLATDLDPQDPQSYIEGLRYKRADNKLLFQPDFFKGFPPQAVQARNLVWDTAMFDNFTGQYLDRLQLNVPISAASNDVGLSGSGTFHNRRIQLTWVGSSTYHGEPCALVHYEALLNTFDMKLPTLTMIGRSDYWGDMWISLRTREIEHATLYEEVSGELTLPKQPVRPIQLLRKGELERLN